MTVSSNTAGTSAINISSGSVKANDGNGTEIFSSAQNGTYTINSNSNSSSNSSNSASSSSSTSSTSNSSSSSLPNTGVSFWTIISLAVGILLIILQFFLFRRKALTK